MTLRYVIPEQSLTESLTVSHNSSFSDLQTAPLVFYPPHLLDNSFCLFKWTYHGAQVWYLLSFPVVSFSVPTRPLSLSFSRSWILQVIEFSAKAPLNNSTRPGGRACSSFAVDSDYHVYTKQMGART